MRVRAGWADRHVFGGVGMTAAVIVALLLIAAVWTVCQVVANFRVDRQRRLP